MFMDFLAGWGTSKKGTLLRRASPLGATVATLPSSLRPITNLIFSREYPKAGAFGMRSYAFANEARMLIV
jgi:hypothetical protein